MKLLDIHSYRSVRIIIVVFGIFIANNYTDKRIRETKKEINEVVIEKFNKIIDLLDDV